MGIRLCLRWVWALGLSVLGVAALLASLRKAAPVTAVHQEVPALGAAFLLRFDPGSQTFFTLPLPTGSLPYDVAVTGSHPVRVWVTEYGTDRIGQLVYTDTAHYEWSEVPITTTARAGPFRLAIHGSDVWFTERSANRVGRLDTRTGQLAEFYGHGLPAGVGLANIDVAPDGMVWVASQELGGLVRLVLTSTGVFHFQVYTHTSMAGVSGLSVESAERIWYTSPGVDHVGCLDLAQSHPRFFSVPPFSETSAPHELLYAFGHTWYSDPRQGAIGDVVLRKIVVVEAYGPVTSPDRLAAGPLRAPLRVWFTQQDRQGSLGYLDYTSPVSVAFRSFPLPLPGLRLQGIAVANDEGVWLAAFRPALTYLPLVFHELASGSAAGLPDK